MLDQDQDANNFLQAYRKGVWNVNEQSLLSSSRMPLASRNFATYALTLGLDSTSIHEMMLMTRKRLFDVAIEVFEFEVEILFAEATTAKISWTTGCILRKDCRSQLLSTQRRVCPCIRGTWGESSNGGERETRKASVSTFPIMFSIMFTIMFPMDFCSLIKIKKRKKSLDSKTKMNKV